MNFFKTLEFFFFLLRYHESNFDKFSKYGPVVREEVLWNYPLYHLFDASDIDKIMKYKSDAPLRPFNEADVYYRKYRSDIFANVGMVNENGPEWLKLRKKLSPPLTNRKTSNYYAEPMNEIADELITVMMQNVDPTTNTLKGITYSIKTRDGCCLIKYTYVLFDYIIDYSNNSNTRAGIRNSETTYGLAHLQLHMSRP